MSVDIVRPVNTKILFQFVEDVENSKFTGETESGIVIVEQEENQVKKNRWGKVLAIGPDVVDEINVGNYIYIEALGWTTTMELDRTSTSTRFWFTDHEKVLLVSEEEPERE
jgi:co-chaperonin GroES (HSP10)